MCGGKKAAHVAAEVIHARGCFCSVKGIDWQLARDGGMVTNPGGPSGGGTVIVAT